MPAPPVDRWTLLGLQSRLRNNRALSHLRAVKRSPLITLVSGPEDDPWRHVRFRRDTVHLWRLEIAVRGDRWERTPFRTDLDELFELLTTELSWVIAPVLDDQGGTSDPT